MESETAQEVMEIQSSLQEELAIKSEFSYDPDKSGKIRDSNASFTLPCRISTIPVLINFEKLGPPLTAYLEGCFYSFFNFWS